MKTKNQNPGRWRAMSFSTSSFSLVTSGLSFPFLAEKSKGKESGPLVTVKDEVERRTANAGPLGTYQTQGIANIRKPNLLPLLLTAAVKRLVLR